MVEEKKIDRSTAINEFRGFLKKYDPKKSKKGFYTDEKIEEDFIDAIEALEDGNLVFNEKMVPTFEYYMPLFPDAENREDKDDRCTLKSRIRTGDKTSVLNGIDLKKQQGTYVEKSLSMMCQISTTQVRELSSVDFDVLNQICSVF